MNRRHLNKRMTENYGYIKNEMTSGETVWAEKFEEMEYSIERGHDAKAIVLATELKGAPLTDTQVAAIKAEKDVKVRCNPVRSASEQARKRKRNKTERVNADNQYDPTDHTDQIIDAQGYEHAVTVSPEDAIINAIDAARDANASLSMLLMYGKTWTPERGKGRPKKGTASESI